MPRAPPALTLLLMAGLMAIAAEDNLHQHVEQVGGGAWRRNRRQHAVNPLERINPWLSACDLQNATLSSAGDECLASTDGRTTGGTQSFFLSATNNQRASSTNQCLVFKESHKDDVCGAQDRLMELRKLRLRHCCEHRVIDTLNSTDLSRLQQDKTFCRQILAYLLEIDAMATRLSCKHSEVLKRYDCAQKYSIAHDCSDCKVSKTKQQTHNVSIFISKLLI